MYVSTLHVHQESLSQDYNATYWQKRYSLKHELPGFLLSAAETILTTGKYLNAMRECGHSVQVQSLGDDYIDTKFSQ